MKKVGTIQRCQTEKVIIDALVKISEIIKKTTNTDQHSKKTTGDGDKKQQRNESDYDEIDDVPIPPPMRTLESYLSSFNKQYATSSSNCNRAPMLLWNSRPYNQRYYSAVKNQRINHNYYDRKSSHKRHRYDNSSSLLRNHHRIRSNKRRPMKCQCQISFDNNEYSASDC